MIECSLQFYLKDTKSSNGTFVNNQRLSKGGEDSAPKEIFSGDIIQLGVDIVENAKKTTFNCIIAMTKLYYPDMREAVPSPQQR
jgi:pSer/pThr/pTyr-binding forkhead associated (FHA) protein